MKTAIADYWMSHSWLEDQKFRANTTRYRETGHAHETLSEYIIRKMDLVRLVYDYTDSEIIRLIMKEALDAWFSIIRVWHGYGKTHGFSKTGSAGSAGSAGTVVDFSTPCTRTAVSQVWHG